MWQGQMQMAVQEDKHEVSGSLFWPSPRCKVPPGVFAALGYQSRLWSHEEVPCALLKKASVAELHWTSTEPLCVGNTIRIMRRKLWLLLNPLASPSHEPCPPLRTHDFLSCVQTLQAERLTSNPLKWACASRKLQISILRLYKTHASLGLAKQQAVIVNKLQAPYQHSTFLAPA